MLSRGRARPGDSLSGGSIKPGIADMGAAFRVEAVETALGEAARRSCNEVVLSGEAGGLLPLALIPLDIDRCTVLVEVEVDG